MPTTVADLPASAEFVYGQSDWIEGSIWTSEQSAQIAWWVDYADVDAFAEAVYGAFESISYPGGAMIRRVPLAHPRYPALYAHHVRVEYDGYDETPTDEWARYRTAKCTVTFALPPYPVTGPIPYLAMQRRKTTDILTIPNIQLRYATSGKPVQQQAARFFPTYALAVTVYNMESVTPGGLALAESSPLNSEPFETPYGTYPVGTVMFQTMTDSRQFFMGGFATYQATLEFKVRPGLRWDYRALENGSGFDRVVLPDGTGFIPMSDLNLIWAD